MTSSELVDFLKQNYVDGRLIDKWKFIYRPYICPFKDLLKEIGSGKKIIDIGCGSGQFALLLAEFIKPKAIYGIDIEDRLIRIANKLLDPYRKKINIVFEVYNGRVLPELINKCDVVTMIDVLHHIPENMHKKFASDLYINMLPASNFILKDIDASNLLVYCNKLHDLLVVGAAGNELTMKEAIKLFTEYGFIVLKMTKRRILWYPHYTVVFKKK
jgi:2-polyprenyl-3-methyl-5-hydroxy-6-metoxy-1,4-benzoquinol methylase